MPRTRKQVENLRRVREYFLARSDTRPTPSTATIPTAATIPTDDPFLGMDLVLLGTTPTATTPTAVYQDKKKETLCFLQAKSAQMKKIRGSAKQKNHIAGPIPFSSKAHKFANAGHHAPFIAAYHSAYEKTDPERATSAMEAADQAAEEMRATQSTTVDGTASSAESTVHISVDQQIRLMEGIVRPSAGTRFRGFGNVQIRQPKTRGPAKGSTRDPVVDEETRDIVAKQAEEISMLKAQMAEDHRINEERYQLMMEMLARARSS